MFFSGFVGSRVVPKSHSSDSKELVFVSACQTIVLVSKFMSLSEADSTSSQEGEYQNPSLTPRLLFLTEAIINHWLSFRTCRPVSLDFSPLAG